MVEIQDLLPYTKKLKLLCVDAEDVTRQSLVKTFSRVFAQVDDADNGYDGLNHYKINQHDLVITETDLPSYSAVQMIEQMKKISPSQHVIVISHKQDAQTLLTWSNMGIEGFVTKPLNMQNLLECMYKSCIQLYSIAQKIQQADASQQIKAQKQQLQQHYENNEKKLNETLAYERKRLGRLLGQEKELQARLSEQEKLLEKVRLIDELTGLPNQRALKHAISESGEKALLFLNIDHFDSINTIYGMGYGNKVLKETALRLERFLPNNTQLYRISADEFVVLILSPLSNQELMLSQQILSMFQESSIIVENIEFDITFSMGMDRGEHAQLFVHAKTASAEARERGRSQMVVFKSDSEYVKEQRQTLYWIQTVKDALVNDRVMSYYQPIYNNQTGNIEKYEALCRILDKNGQVLNADSFINSAALAGLMTKISRVMIDKAFKYFQNNSYSFSLNVSAQDFHENYLEDFLQYKCDYYNIKAQRVYLEIIEGLSTSKNDKVVEQIKRLRAKGFNITIDDFGVDQSVFSRLVRLEAKTIKIDSSFIENLDTNISNQMIVQNIVSFAKRIGAETVAEFVNTKQVQDKVHELGINYSQGFYIGKPAEHTVMETMQGSVNNIA